MAIGEIRPVKLKHGGEQMAFSEQVVEQAWRRSGGRCECPRVSDGHPNPHGKRLDKANRGRTGEGCWEAHHIVAGEPRDLVVAQDLEVETPEIEVFLSCLRDEGYIYRTWADNDEEQYIPRVTAVGTGQGGGNVGLAKPLAHLADDPVSSELTKSTIPGSAAPGGRSAVCAAVTRKATAFGNARTTRR